MRQVYRRLIQESPQAFPVEQTLQHFDAGMQLFATGWASARIAGSIAKLGHAIVKADTFSAESTAGASWSGCGDSVWPVAAARSSNATALRRGLATFIVE
ncbi:MAG TPA: hypothetical protein VNJ70_00695 [Thermoanaerobaculia bacterium]|nr:hypothetical protein [Thermoanaerobaculia bacterium]